MSFRLLITGARVWTDWIRLNKVLDEEFNAHPDLTLVHGDCPTGADRMASDWAVLRDQEVPQEKYPAKWDLYGKSAGPLRNKQMVMTKPDLCIAFIKGEAKGTRHCLKTAQEAGIPTKIVEDQ